MLASAEDRAVLDGDDAWASPTTEGVPVGVAVHVIRGVAAEIAGTVDGAAAFVARDPAAFVGRVARDRAVGDGGAAVVAEDPAAAVDAGRIDHDRATRDVGVAVVIAVDPPAAAGAEFTLGVGFVGRVARDRGSR